MGRKLYLIESLNLKKGDIFKFGRWEGKPIEWQVLKSSGNDILCISKYCLAKRRYDKDSDDWEKSELRQWLNSDFYNRAFNSEERSFLLPYQSDKVTLLSIEKVKKYLPSKSERVATFRDGARAWWWLRSRSDYNDYAAYVCYDGVIIDYILVDFASGAVRPAIYLKKDVENYLESEA